MARGIPMYGDDEKGPERKPKFKLPAGFDSEAEFLANMRKLYDDDVSFDFDNRQAALEDLQFVAGDQWDLEVVAERESADKPVLTINRLPAFVAQVIGSRRLNETAVKVLPDTTGTKAIAHIREGLIRSIQKISNADAAYDKALEGSAMCGIGNFQVYLDYDDDDVFEQTIKICQVSDHLSVVWDRLLSESTGRDAGHVFVPDTVPRKDFERQWPWATVSDIALDATLRSDLRSGAWFDVDDVRIVSFWRMQSHKRTLALMRDGGARDVTDDLADADRSAALLAEVVTRDDGSPIMREVNRKYAQLYLCSGADILDGPYELPISRVPVFRVPGWELDIQGKKHRWGIVRFLKDPQRLHNWWRSIIAEKIMQTPRAVWLAAKSAVQGREKEFRESHKSDNSLLVWNDESGHKPERVPPAQVEDSLLGQAILTTQDIKDVSNIHEANLGMPSNEVSGVAIQARQRVSDTGTIIYHDNLAQAIEECGRVINELIPMAYDTPRIIKVLGEDGAEDLALINDKNDPRAVDISVGRYSVTVATGASFQTKRIESAQMLMALSTAMPQVFAIAADIIVEAQDIPGADKIAKRIQASMPPGLLEEKDLTPQQKQAQAQASEQAAKAQQLQVSMAVAEYMKKLSETEVNHARAQHFAAQAADVPQKTQTAAVEAASKSADRELRGHLETIRVAEGD